MGDLAKVEPRMTDEEADAWRRRLMTWIAKNHPHLANREELWEEWKKSALIETYDHFPNGHPKR